MSYTVLSSTITTSDISFAICMCVLNVKVCTPKYTLQGLEVLLSLLHWGKDGEPTSCSDVKFIDGAWILQITVIWVGYNSLCKHIINKMGINLAVQFVPALALISQTAQPHYLQICASHYDADTHICVISAEITDSSWFSVAFIAVN